ncbi:hypothetical protein ACFLU6_12220 [Acidobacteriota bacterium]
MSEENRTKRTTVSIGRLLIFLTLTGLVSMPAPAQDDCNSATSVASLPYTDSFDTTGLNNFLDPMNAPCVGGFEEPGPDAIYSYIPAADESIGIVLVPSGWDAALYVITDCADPYNTCLAGSDYIGNFEESIALVNLTQDVEYFIVVDSFDMSSSGSYTIDIGDDFCRNPEIMTPPPYSYSGDTTSEFNKFDPAGCMGVVEAPGRDMLFSYTTGAVTEVVNVILTTTDPNLDVILYTAADCGDVPGSCVAAADAGLSGDPEELQNIVLDPGTTYYVFADAWQDGGPFTLEMTQGVDPCQSAITISAFPYDDPAGDTTTATNNFSADGCPGLYLTPRWKDVAYKYTPAAAMSVNVSVTPTDPLFDPMLYVVTDCWDPGSSCVRAADVWSFGYQESIVNLPLAAGTDYYFIVDAESTEGTYTFQLGDATDPCTDPIVLVDPLPPPAFVDVSSTTSRLNSFDPVAGCADYPFSQPSQDVAYEFTPAANGFVDITLEPDAGFDPSLYIITDCLDAQTSCIAISDEGGSVDETLSLFGAAGTTYYIVVDSLWGDGGYTITIDQAVDPCSTATAVPSLPFNQSGDTAASTDQINDLGICTGFSQAGPDEIYTYAPSSDEFIAITVTPLSMGYDPSIYVFGTCTDVPGSCIVGTDQGLSGDAEVIDCLGLTAGMTYYIAVDGFDQNGGGPYQIDISTTTPPAVTLLVVKSAPDNLQLSWNAGCQSFYSVKRGEILDWLNMTQIAWINQITHTDAGVLNDGVNYFYKVE